jgi:hypothetical protein
MLDTVKKELARIKPLTGQTQRVKEETFQYCGGAALPRRVKVLGFCGL